MKYQTFKHFPSLLATLRGDLKSQEKTNRIKFINGTKDKLGVVNPTKGTDREKKNLILHIYIFILGNLFNK